MTEKANPSINRGIEAFKTAGAIAYGGHGTDGYIIDDASPTEISIQDGDITHGNFNSFSASTSATSFDVTIGAGEAFVYGSWIATDTNTTVTLASSTSNQTVYVGWNKDGSDDLIVGLQAAFDNATGNTDMKIPIWDFTTDGSGVTSSTDRRNIGKTISGSVSHPTTSQSSSYLTTGETILFVDTSSSTVTITLSDADTRDGNETIIVDAGGNAETNAITIDTESSQTIDGASSTSISSNYGATRVVSDGSDWFTAGGGGSGSGGALSDSGTDTDAGDDYVLPNPSDNIDLQGDGSVYNAEILDALFAKHNYSISNDYTVGSGEGTVIAGPLEGSGSISGDGRLSVVGPGGSGYNLYDIINSGESVYIPPRKARTVGSVNQGFTVESGATLDVDGSFVAFDEIKGDGEFKGQGTVAVFKDGTAEGGNVGYQKTDAYFHGGLGL